MKSHLHLAWEKLALRVALAVAGACIVVPFYAFTYWPAEVVAEADPYAAPEPLAVFANEQAQDDPSLSLEVKRLFAESLNP